MKKKSQSVNIDIPVWYLEYWSGGDFTSLPPNKTYKLIIDYPIADDAVFNVHTNKNGMGLISLLKKIGQVYRHIYKYEEKYGVWGHSIDDLAIEGIRVNHKTKTIKLLVGS